MKTSQKLLLFLLFVALTVLLVFFGEAILYFLFDQLLVTGLLLLALVLLVVFLRKKPSGRIIRRGSLLVLAAVAASIGLGFLLDSLGINLMFPVREKLTAEQAGTVTEPLNSGSIAETADYVFYLEPAKEMMPSGRGPGSLIRRNRDWTEPTVLTESSVSWFVTDGTWLYCIIPSKNSSIVRMDFNGGSLETLTEDRANRLISAGGSLYYGTSDGIVRIRPDGSERTVLINETGWPAVLTDDGWLYYQPTLRTLSRVRTDGTGQEDLVEDLDDFKVAPDGLYYLKLEETSENAELGRTLRLYRRTDKDPVPQELPFSPRIHFAKFSGDALYYQKSSDNGRLTAGIWRSGLDGSDPVRLNKISVWSFQDILGDWIYFLQYSGKQYRVRLDGSVGVLFQ